MRCAMLMLGLRDAESAAQVEELDRAAATRLRPFARDAVQLGPWAAGAYVRMVHSPRQQAVQHGRPADLWEQFLVWEELLSPTGGETIASIANRMVVAGRIACGPLPNWLSWKRRLRTFSTSSSLPHARTLHLLQPPLGALRTSTSISLPSRLSLPMEPAQLTGLRFLLWLMALW